MAKKKLEKNSITVTSSVDAYRKYQQSLIENNVTKFLSEGEAKKSFSQYIFKNNLLDSKGQKFDLEKIINPGRQKIPDLAPLIDGKPGTWAEVEEIIKQNLDSPLVVSTRVTLVSVKDFEKFTDPADRKVLKNEQLSSQAVAKFLSTATNKNKSTKPSPKFDIPDNAIKINLNFKKSKNLKNDPKKEEFLLNIILGKIKNTTITPSPKPQKYDIVIFGWEKRQLLYKAHFVVKVYYQQVKDGIIVQQFYQSTSPINYSKTPVDSQFNKISITGKKGDINPIKLIEEQIYDSTQIITHQFQIGHYSASELTKNLKDQRILYKRALEKANEDIKQLPSQKKLNEKALREANKDKDIEKLLDQNEEDFKKLKDIFTEEAETYERKIEVITKLIDESVELDKFSVLSASSEIKGPLLDEVLSNLNKNPKNGIYIAEVIKTTETSKGIQMKLDVELTSTLGKNFDTYLLELARVNLSKSGMAAQISRRATALAYQRGSVPRVLYVLFKELTKIFNDKSFYASVKKESPLGITANTDFFPANTKIRAKRRNKITGKTPKNRTKLKRPSAQGSVMYDKLDSSSQEIASRGTTQNIVPLINADLKRYVLEQMSYPSLENRSGRFAGSVRVLSAQENAAVQYTYQKSPYQVFSPSRGKRPWATEERDPAKIIDRAIKKLGQDRFQKVFRTEEV